MHKPRTLPATGLSDFWQCVRPQQPGDDSQDQESPEQILVRLGLTNLDRVPSVAHWRDLIDWSARSLEEMAVQVAKMLRIWLVGLTRAEWDALIGISEAERGEPEMVRKHEEVKNRLARFVERWDVSEPAPGAALRYREVRNRIDAALLRAQSCRFDASREP